MRSAVLSVLAAGLLWAPAFAQEQTADVEWRPEVAAPAYAADGPLVRVDEAHGSVQTIDGRYAGFAALARADGYVVDAWRTRLDAPGALDDVSVLVISNPASPPEGSGRTSAFNEAEIEAIAYWVQAGGSLLLAADHAPHGAAAEALAARFGVEMGKGYLFQIAPDGPTTAKISPPDTEKVTSSRTVRVPECVVKTLWRWETSIMGYRAHCVDFLAPGDPDDPDT